MNHPSPASFPDPMQRIGTPVTPPPGTEPNPAYQELLTLYAKVYGAGDRLEKALRPARRTLSGGVTWTGPTARRWTTELDGWDRRLGTAAAQILTELSARLRATPPYVAVGTRPMVPGGAYPGAPYSGNPYPIPGAPSVPGPDPGGTMHPGHDPGGVLRPAPINPGGAIHRAPDPGTPFHGHPDPGGPLRSHPEPGAPLGSHPDPGGPLHSHPEPGAPLRDNPEPGGRLRPEPDPGGPDAHPRQAQA